MKTCREHAELDLSINLKNFGNFFKIDILAIKISFPEFFFFMIMWSEQNQSGIYIKINII